MHPWPSWNGRTRNAVSMSIWVCTCTRPHYFYCPSPDFANSIVSQSVTNNRCAPSCGGTREKWGAHQKIFGRRFAPAFCPHLQIASDATANCIIEMSSASGGFAPDPPTVALSISGTPPLDPVMGLRFRVRHIVALQTELSSGNGTRKERSWKIVDPVYNT